MSGWRAPLPPDAASPMHGRHCRLEPLDVAVHTAPMHDALQADSDGSMWTYTGIYELRGEMTQPASMAQVHRWLTAAAEHSTCFVIIAPSISQRPVGTVAFESIQPRMGALQGTTAATEAHWLMLRRAFESGYRRVEWSCDELNSASRRAAARLGYQFEGVLRYTRQKPASIELPLSGTAYFSILEFEWPAVSTALQQWLSCTNFDGAGRQRNRLSDLMLAAAARQQQQPKL